LLAAVALTAGCAPTASNRAEWSRDDSQD